MKMIRSGGMKKKKKDGENPSGLPEEIADEIFLVFRDKKFLG